MDHCQIFWNALGSGIGGFIGVLIFFSVRAAIEKYRTKPQFVTRYYVANDLNVGQEKESYGQILHGYGSRITDENDLEKYGFKNPVWEWKKENVKNILIYGPYATDLNEPGKYRIEFTIKGIGFSKPDEIIKDYILFEIDVLETVSRTEPRNETDPTRRLLFSDVIRFSESNIIGKKYLRVSDLANSRNSKFCIIVNSNGKGIWEYRASAYDGTGGSEDNLSKFGNTIRIFFDKIEVYKIRDYHLPWY